MPAVPNAICHLSNSYATADHRVILTTNQTRTNDVQEWAIDWLGEPPTTEQASTPSGYTWSGCRNEPVDLWATDGTDTGLWRHVDVYTKKGPWKND